MIFAQVTLKTTSLKWLSRSLLLKCLWRRLLLKEFNMTSLDNHLTLKMASAQVVETSVANNSLSQDSNHADDLFHSRHRLSQSNNQVHCITANQPSPLWWKMRSGIEFPNKSVKIYERDVSFFCLNWWWCWRITNAVISNSLRSVQPTYCICNKRKAPKYIFFCCVLEERENAS